jgi:dTMP kinase
MTPIPDPLPGQAHCQRGALVSVEGITGSGKTYLTRQLTAHLAAAGCQATAIDDFSTRREAPGPDLGREFLHALINASGGDRYLRGGHLQAETLLLLAIKTYDYEASTRRSRPWQLILEGRSIDTIAVYQSVLMHPADDAALVHAREILQLARIWRPLPDLTILITDEPIASLRRASDRDQRPFTRYEQHIEHRADALYRRLAAEDPARIRFLNRPDCDTGTAIRIMHDWITGISQGLECQPLAGTGEQCGHGCRVGRSSAGSRRPRQAPI